MANVLPKEKQVQVIAALAEGNSIRSVERMTGIHRDTVMRLGVKVGTACEAILDEKMQSLNSPRIEVDEIWGFVGAKDRNLMYTEHAHYGSVWTFVAVDAETKVVPCFKVGKHDAATANAFMDDLSNRLANRVQISADALNAYIGAVKGAFDSDNVDFGQVVKEYSSPIDRTSEAKYSPGRVVSVEKGVVFGAPDLETVSTSYIERQNLTMRMHIRRLTRLTNAFSKKVENFRAAVGLHFAYYNFVKRHGTLRMTPAMAAGIEKDFWTVENLVEAALSDSYIQGIQEAIRKTHGYASSHVGSVPVKETFKGQTVWEGTVEVFDLAGHDTARQCFAWGWEDGDRWRYVAVLRVPQVNTARKAVQAFIVSRAGKT